jgi:tetratricopeptide (TPR) repeat protein
MPDDRIAALQRMLDRNPDDTRARFGLALEYEKLGQWRAAAEQLRAYLERADDEGNAWGRLGHVLRQLGDHVAARDAYRRGIDAAYRYGHPSMAFEFQETIAEMYGDGDGDGDGDGGGGVDGGDR